MPVAEITTPWTAAHLPGLSWTQSADTLLVLHATTSPRLITRSGHTAWNITPWTSRPTYASPHGKFGDPHTQMAVWNDDGLTLRAERPYFSPEHVGTTFRVGAMWATATSFLHNQRMTCTVTGPTTFGPYTFDWSEPLFNPVRGWPVCATFHQNRLAVAGTLDRPNTVWLSKVGDFFNFHPGDGLDDEAIEFPLLSDQVNAVTHLVSAGPLQVFTTGGEWTLSGEPLTPASLLARRQTQVGSLSDRSVPPAQVEGATLFAAASGRELREFLFSDVEQSYQSADLALLARHLFRDPVDMAYDPVERLLHVVMADGSLATVTNFRREQVTAWTRQETQGLFLAVAVVGRQTYALVLRAGALFLEVFDDTLNTDAALTGSSPIAKTLWSGLGHLEGQTLTLLADGTHVDPAEVTGGSITLAEPAKTVEAGLPFTHVVEPLPPLSDGPEGGGNGRQTRLIRASFRLLETPALTVDTGRGAKSIPFKRLGSSGVLDTPPLPFTGDATVRALGWQRDSIRPLWRIEQDAPLPCTVLSVTTEMKVTR